MTNIIRPAAWRYSPAVKKALAVLEEVDPADVEAITIQKLEPYPWMGEYARMHLGASNSAVGTISGFTVSLWLVPPKGPGYHLNVSDRSKYIIGYVERDAAFGAARLFAPSLGEPPIWDWTGDGDQVETGGAK